ncbi:hypothetical protein Tco_1335228 [Tanacetum coccineum]
MISIPNPYQFSSFDVQGHVPVLRSQGSGWNNLAHSNVTGGAIIPLVNNTTHVAYHTNIHHTGFLPGPPAGCYPFVGPPGFIQRQDQNTGTIGQTVHTESIGLTVILGQETTLPHAFTTGILHDPATGG